MNPTAVRIADGDDDTRIEGWAVPFIGHLAGDKDAYGTRFSAQTEYALDWFPDGRPMLYGHGTDPENGVAPVGRVTSLEVRDAGIWMQGQIDKGNAYFEAIRDMVKAGKLFLSSGSVEHLVKVDARSGDMISWPIVEISLTPVPANLLATVSMRSAEDHYTAAGLAVPDALRDAMMPDDMASTDDDDDDTGTDERSFEDICSDLDALLNPMYAPAYTRRINTYATHVLVQRYDEDDEGTYWDIPYTIGADLEPVLGTPTQVMHTESYIPVARAAAMPLSLHAQLMIRHAATFARSTQDYGERRFREGRMMSGANMQTLSDTADGMQSHVDTLRALHKRASAQKDEAARAAQFSDPETVRLRLALLELALV